MDSSQGKFVELKDLFEEPKAEQERIQKLPTLYEGEEVSIKGVAFIVKKIKQNDYLIMDAILIILGRKGQLEINKLQYELLNCGIIIQQPLLNEAISELKKNKAVS